METPSPYALGAQVDAAFSAGLAPGAERPFKGVTLAHYPIADLGLAAALGTLGIPFRDPAPFSDDVELDAAGNECSRMVCFWLDEIVRDPEATPHKTVALIKAWGDRAQFEKDNPLHSLNAMRAALDSRQWWLDVIKRRAALPDESRAAPRYETDSIHAASVLRACGFRPLAFTGRAFVLAATQQHVHAEAVLLEAAKVGQTPAQFMSRVLINRAHLQKLVNSQRPTLRFKDGDTTLLLSADATPRTQDRFHRLFQS